MAFTFKKTLEGVSIGNSLFDQPGSEKVKEIMEKAKKNGVKVVFPVDYVTADKFAADAEVGSATDAEGIKEGWMGLDAGPKSRELFKETILASKTILWNGPAGVFEFENFAAGSKASLDACIEAASKGATVIVGGGDTATVVASEWTGKRRSLESRCREEMRCPVVPRRPVLGIRLARRQRTCVGADSSRPPSFFPSLPILRVRLFYGAPCNKQTTRPRTSSATSRLAVVPRSSCSRARTCQASLPSRRSKKNLGDPPFTVEAGQRLCVYATGTGFAELFRATQTRHHFQTFKILSKNCNATWHDSPSPKE